MRVLIVGSHERAVMNFRATLIEKLAQEHEVTVAIWSRDSVRRTDIEALGAQVVYLRSTSGSLRPFKDIRALAKLAWLVIKQRPDRAFVYASKPIGFAGSLLRIMRLPYVCLMEGLGSGYREGGLLWRLNHAMFSFAYHGARRVFLLNKENRESLIRWGLCPPEKIELLDGIGVDLERFGMQPHRDDRPRVLFLGRITRSKGVPLFFRAAALIVRNRPEARFIAAGPLVENRDGLTSEEILEYTAQDGIDYVGDKLNVLPLLASASVVVVPSVDGCEGLPMVLQEAFAVGRPVIGTDVAGTRDGLADGGGFLVMPNDIDVLVSTIERLLSDRQGLEEMGRKARKIAEARFDRRRADNVLETAILTA